MAAHAQNLYIFAKMPQALVQPYRQLMTGHFLRDHSYKTFRLHGTGDWLMMFTLHGSGRCGFEQGELWLGRGDVVLIAPGALHDYRALEVWEFIWVHFQPRAHWLEWLSWPLVSSGLMYLHLEPEQHQAVEPHLRQMHAQAISGHPRRTDLAMHALEGALLALSDCNPDLSSPFDPRISKAMAFMRQLLGQHLDLETVAAACNLSVSRLSHLFRAEVGIGVMSFLELERLSRAASLLELTSQSISEIGLEVGFADAFHFSKRFRRWSGLSPRAYRNQVG